MSNLLRERDFKRVRSYFEMFRSSYPDINKLMSGLENYGELILIGGALRDIAFYKRQPRDFDIIIDTKSLKLENAFKDFEFTRNRFGGYKLIVNGFEFDIWSIQYNWAFKQNLFKQSFENIAEGTFFNIDSIVLNLNKGTWDAKHFNYAISHQLLDIVLDDNNIDLNPTPEINVARAIVLKNQYNLKFSPRVENYVTSWVSKTKRPVICIKQALFKHYGNDDYISNEEINNALSFV